MAATEPETRTVTIDGIEVVLTLHRAYTTISGSPIVTEKVWWQSPQTITRELSLAQAREEIAEQWGREGLL
jgi:hypothetical protein